MSKDKYLRAVVKKSQNLIKLSWDNYSSFGNIDIYIEEDGKTTIDTEYMNLDFVWDVLNAWKEGRSIDESE